MHVPGERRSMPKRTDIESILIIGAGPIVIGQACEFDYSGAQACKALREEGYRVILVNSNPATIMTDPEMADATYIEPVNWQTVERIIEKEKPDALLPTMGGQTALNCALDLDREGVLEKHNVEMIGAKKEAINKAEDRDLFRDAMKKIGLAMPKSEIVHNLEEAKAAMSGLYTSLRDATVSKKIEPIAKYVEEFNSYMNDDFNTPKAISVLHELAKELNRCADKSSDEAMAIATTLHHFGGVLGLLQDDAQAFLQGKAGANDDGLDEAAIQKFIDERSAAKSAKDYAKADEIRDHLTSLGISLEDTPNGTTWRRN